MIVFFRKAIASLAIVVTTVMAASPNDVQAEVNRVKTMKVSFYGGGGKNECGRNNPCHGSPVKCGDGEFIFNKNGMTAASNTLPCWTLIKACNVDGICVTLLVNDTGNFDRHGRDLDVSLAAAELLNFKDVGTATLKVTPLMQLSKPEPENNKD